MNAKSIGIGLPILLKVLLTTLSIVVHSLQFNTNDSSDRYAATQFVLAVDSEVVDDNYYFTLARPSVLGPIALQYQHNVTII